VIHLLGEETPDWATSLESVDAMAESEDTRPAIGIDLGTTNSRVGIWLEEENRFELISNDHGNRSTPSYVAFTETERLIGDPAKDQVSRNPANTIFGAFRSRNGLSSPFFVSFLRKCLDGDHVDFCEAMYLDKNYFSVISMHFFHPNLATSSIFLVE